MATKNVASRIVETHAVRICIRAHPDYPSNRHTLVNIDIDPDSCVTPRGARSIIAMIERAIERAVAVRTDV